MRRFFVPAGIAVAIIVTILLIGEFVTSVGKRASLSVAQEIGYCAGEQCTDQETDIFYLTLGEIYNAPPLLIDWCLGIDDLAGIRVHRGGFIKSIFIWAGQLPCGRFMNEQDQ